MKILLDSNGWIEFFTDGPLADRYVRYPTPKSQLITPAIVLYEDYKKIKWERGTNFCLGPCVPDRCAEECVRAIGLRDSLTLPATVVYKEVACHERVRVHSLRVRDIPCAFHENTE